MLILLNNLYKKRRGYGQIWFSETAASNTKGTTIMIEAIATSPDRKTGPGFDVTLDALAHLICGESNFDSMAGLDRAQKKWHKLPSAMFDGFELIHPEHSEDDDFILIGDNPADQPIWPMDVSLGTPCPDDGEWPEGSWWFSRVRTLPLKDWRGKLTQMMPRMVEVSHLIASPDGSQVSVRTPFGITSKRTVKLRVQITNQSLTGAGDNIWSTPPSYFGERDRNTADGQDDDRLCRAAGFALRREYLWSVLIGEGSGPRARFVTDPIGVREAFRLRDIPPGAARRKALLHWVREHWRKRRAPSAEERSWIKQHLRGQWSYTWNGLHCQIEPSVEDLKLAS